MEWFWGVVGLLLAAAVLSMLVRQAGQAAFAMLLTLTVGALVWVQLLPRLSQIVQVFADLAEEAGLAQEYLAVIVKIILISYLVEFGAALCRDAGESAFAAKMEVAGKLAVISLSVPVVAAVLGEVLAILPKM